MIRSLFIAALYAICLSLNAQEKKDTVIIFEDYETNASFQGGYQGLEKYLEENVQWPKNEPKCYKVFVSVLINEDGSISDAKIVKGINENFDNEALRIVNSMPKWIPSSYYGKKRKQRMIIPIIFDPTKS